MPIRRRVHAGHVYLGKEVMDALGVKDGIEVEIEVRGGLAVIKPVRKLDEDTLDLLKLLEEAEASGNREDYFGEYGYEDVGG